MIVATAGHVDHGKSSLIRAITGQETDRLPEEKERGLSIDIGFAHCTSPDIAFVDVPGHEKFLRNMLAGIAGVDAVLLAVAADEGVMPQTREHVELLDLLGIERGIVALTRADLVSEEGLEQVSGNVQDWLADTGLRDAVIIPTSTKTGAGIQDVVAALARLPDVDHGLASTRRFRFLVDRTFSLSGIGLVTTGTVTAGTALSGDNVHVLPRGGGARIRSLQRHDDAVEQVSAGQRAAINLTLSSTDRSSIKRGDWLVDTANTPSTMRFDGRVRLNPKNAKPLKHWHSAQLFIGASHYAARVAVVGGDSIEPGDATTSTGYVQLVLEQAVHVAFGDRFVLRDGAAGTTIAGGSVVDPFPPTQKRARHNRLAMLEGLDTTDDKAALQVALSISSIGCDIEEFRAARQVRSATTFDDVAMVSVQAGRNKRYISEGRYQSLASTLLDVLAEWHKEHPDEVGPDAHQLRSKIEKTLDPALWLGLIDLMIRSGEINRSPAGISLPDHRPRLSQADEDRWDALSSLIQPDNLQPPALKDLAAHLSIERDELADSVNRIAASGRLIRIAANRYFHPQALLALGHIAVTLEQTSENAGFTARQYRDVSHIGRNLTIDVLEYFDRIRLTRRIGDQRRVIATPETVLGSQ